MESVLLGEGGQWEARRVAAAFGVRSFKLSLYDGLGGFCFEGVAGAALVSWIVDEESEHVVQIEVGTTRGQYKYSRVFWSQAQQCWQGRAHQKFNARMVQGLYCLGIEGALANTILKHPLGAQEQHQLRLCLPREFWPETWRAEAGATREEKSDQKRAPGDCLKRV